MVLSGLLSDVVANDPVAAGSVAVAVIASVAGRSGGWLRCRGVRVRRGSHLPGPWVEGTWPVGMAGPGWRWLAVAAGLVGDELSAGGERREDQAVLADGQVATIRPDPLLIHTVVVAATTFCW